MKSVEFMVEDTCAILWTEFLDDLNLEYAKEGRIFEAKEGKNISNFLHTQSLTPVPNKLFYFVTVLWMDSNDSTVVSVATSEELYRVISIKNDGRIEVENTMTGKQRLFPEVAGPVTSNIQGSALFNSVKDRDQFLTLFGLRFSELNIKIKEL